VEALEETGISSTLTKIVEFNRSIKLKNQSLQDMCLCEYFECENSLLISVQVLYIKVKVTWTLEQATKAQRRSRGTVPLFL
jgi:hypothetical protein